MTTLDPNVEQRVSRVCSLHQHEGWVGWVGQRVGWVEQRVGWVGQRVGWVGQQVGWVGRQVGKVGGGVLNKAGLRLSTYSDLNVDGLSGNAPGVVTGGGAKADMLE